MRKSILGWVLLLSSFSIFAEVTVSEGWVRAMPPGSYMSAAYISFENKTDEVLKLIAVTSTAANDCSIHETVIKDGVNRMHQLHELVLPPATKVRLQPGGIHIMLMDMNKPLTEGEMFPLRLEFSDGSVKKIALKIARGVESE